MARVVPRAGAPESFADLTAQLQPAVVNISTRQRIEVSNNAGNPFAGTPFEGLFNRRGGQQQERRDHRNKDKSIASAMTRKPASLGWSASPTS